MATIATSASTVFDGVFVAYRKAHLAFIKNSIMSLAKVALPLVFLSFGLSGIFLANTVSMIIACMLGILLLFFKLKHITKPYLSRSIIKGMGRFSIENYIATFIENITPSLLPILIINRTNASASGYFYIDMMIINALYIIPSAMSQVMFAEGSREENNLLTIYKKASLFIYALVVPAIALVIILGREVLDIFGKNFAIQGYSVLILLSLAAIPVSAKLLVNVIFNIEHRLGLVIATNIVTATIVMTISYLTLPKGLIWVGVAWIIGECCGTLVSLILLLLKSDTMREHPYRRQLFALYSIWKKTPPIS
jgi:O-antigen/teichoic acid export membrane protein